jgi:hypothetical protein
MGMRTLLSALWNAPAKCLLGAQVVFAPKGMIFVFRQNSHVSHRIRRRAAFLNSGEIAQPSAKTCGFALEKTK